MAKPNFKRQVKQATATPPPMPDMSGDSGMGAPMGGAPMGPQPAAGPMANPPSFNPSALVKKSKSPSKKHAPKSKSAY